jgi:hypothetical protein
VAIIARATRRLFVTRGLEIATALALIAGVLLFIAEFLDLFQVETGQGLVVHQAGAEQGTGENHAYAMALIGIGVIVATMVTRSSGAWAPAAGVMALGAVAVAIALIGDLPDATSSGLTTKFESANAHPAAGFWLELAGGVGALGSGLALTYLLRRRQAAGAEGD